MNKIIKVYISKKPMVWLDDEERFMHLDLRFIEMVRSLSMEYGIDYEDKYLSKYVKLCEECYE